MAKSEHHKKKVAGKMNTSQIIAKRKVRTMKWIGCYKTTTRSLTTFFYAILNLALIFVFTTRLISSMNANYLIGRTRGFVTEEVNFEKITTNKVRYFLYYNKTEGAKDATDMKVKNFITESELKAFCFSDQGDNSWMVTGNIGASLKSREHTDEMNHGMPEYRDQADDLKKIRKNYTGFFERLTEITVISLMTVLTIYNTFYVPNYLRENSIPLMFRSSDSN